MAEYLIQEETLNQIAEAIRAKTGEEGGMTPVEMPEKIGSIEGIWEKMQKGTLTEWVDDEITVLNTGSFFGCDSLQTISCKKLTEIHSKYPFSSCIALTNVELPQLEKIIGDYAFYRTEMLNEVDLSNLVLATGLNIFAESGMLKLNIPLLKNVPYGLCQNCRKLQHLFLPAAEVISGYLCSRSQVTHLMFPSLSKVGSSYNFLECYELTTVDFPKLLQILGAENFKNCSALTALILRNTTMATLSNINNFVDSGIANGTGYIYVPAALIEEYKSATNWSTYATQFRALEDYTVDGTITGELDETKIAEAAE